MGLEVGSQIGPAKLSTFSAWGFLGFWSSGMPRHAAHNLPYPDVSKNAAPSCSKFGTYQKNHEKWETGSKKVCIRLLSAQRNNLSD